MRYRGGTWWYDTQKSRKHPLCPPTTQPGDLGVNFGVWKYKDVKLFRHANQHGRRKRRTANDIVMTHAIHL